jgi:hypothetical protein
LFVLEGEPHQSAVGQLLAADFHVKLHHLGDAQVAFLLAVSTAFFPASAQDLLLVPITSITLS